jgi:hypothetical protein
MDKSGVKRADDNDNFPVRTFHQKNQGSVKIKQKPVTVIGLLTGHRRLKGHLFKMGLMDSSICERCLEKDESAIHILCD